jgi:hypothetical protein
MGTSTRHHFAAPLSPPAAASEFPVRGMRLALTACPRHDLQTCITQKALSYRATRSPGRNKLFALLSEAAINWKSL